MEDGGGDGTRTLHILGAEYHHSGDISCEISLQSNSNVNSRQVAYTNLAVLPIEGVDTSDNSGNEISPCFIRGPSDSTALSGSTVTLEAFYRGKPEPQVKWMRGV